MLANEKASGVSRKSKLIESMPSRMEGFDAGELKKEVISECGWWTVQSE